MVILKSKIYIDILISLNLFVNYFILLSVARFLYLKVKRLRLLFGALLGSVYSLYILLPEPSKFISFIIKILMSFSIVFASFKFEKKTFWKIFICFFLMSISFSGLMLAMWIMFRPNGMIMNNSVVYFNISPFTLIISTLVSYFAIEVANRLLGKHVCKDAFCNVKLFLNNKMTSFEAKLDTGNSLKEPFSNLPVLVVDREKIKDIIPDEFNIDKFKDVSNFSSQTNSSIRLIPFSGVSNGGFLIGFKPDNAVFETGKGNIFNKDIYVGVCFEKELQYALVGPDILNVI